tara:strand:- start:58 stop:582 length:525 start_codon:yes stop_codon:yes gene_type:complete
MAGQRLTDKAALTQQLANDDLLMIVDTSDTTGSADGTSKKIDNKFIIQTDTITGNLDLLTNPLLLVAAPGSGYFIQPITCSVIYKHNSTASTVGNYVYVSYDVSSTAEYIVRQRDFIKNDSADRSFVFGNNDANSADGAYAGDMENRSLAMYSNADLGGDGSFKVYITYQIVKT